MPHHVNVVELDHIVLMHSNFRGANLAQRSDKPCLYVGMTGHTPEERLAQHKSKVEAAKSVRRCGIRLRPKLYELHNPVTFEDAGKMEKEMARPLRGKGFAVWQK